MYDVNSVLHTVMGVWPRELKAQHGEHLGQGANPSQSIITYYGPLGNANKPTEPPCLQTRVRMMMMGKTPHI